MISLPESIFFCLDKDRQYFPVLLNIHMKLHFFIKISAGFLMAVNPLMVYGTRCGDPLRYIKTVRSRASSNGFGPVKRDRVGSV
jgi:hypothetical protein